MSEDLTKKLPKTDSEKIALILTTVQNLETRVDNLEHKVDERLYDTRPIWEKVVADIGKLQEGQNRLEGSVQEISDKLDVLNEAMLNVQAKQRDVNRRVRELESQRKPTNSQT